MSEYRPITEGMARGGDGVKKLSCKERDALLLDKTKMVGLDWGVGASLTDFYGEFGEPRIQTTWEGPDGIRVMDIRHPNPHGGADAEPCEHYTWIEAVTE